ncbi:hypothetical protein [Vreelandella profundi]|uniref:hypothetical protein n=1 Tax=Vreelandella profundi TaxID=2852117 RepID=UPI001F3A2F24|nr:hypothetical protein [Halomonas profundi]
MADHIYTPGDVRGRFKVYVDSKLLSRCFYADTKRGIADAYATNKAGQVKLDKYRKRTLTKRYRGKVEVVPCD